MIARTKSPFLLQNLNFLAPIPVLHHNNFTTITQISVSIFVADVEKFFMDLLESDNNLSAGIGMFIFVTRPGFYFSTFVIFSFYSCYKDPVGVGGEN